MKNKEDKAITDFFAHGKNEVADNGFSDRVTNFLPQRNKNSRIVPIFALLGLCVTLMTVDIQKMAIDLYYLFCVIHPQYIYVGIILFSLLTLLVWFLCQNKHSSFSF